jgi:hypothetical protein
MCADPGVAKENIPPAPIRAARGAAAAYSGATGGVPASLAIAEFLP